MPFVFAHQHAHKLLSLVKGRLHVHSQTSINLSMIFILNINVEIAKLPYLIANSNLYITNEFQIYHLTYCILPVKISHRLQKAKKIIPPD